MKPSKALLSTAWIFITLNYLYCDILGIMDPTQLGKIIAGNIDGVLLTQEFLLGASVLMEIPIAMVVLARILPFKPNRWANIVAGTIMTIVQIGSLFFGSSVTMYYAFFSIIEIGCSALIVWSAFHWQFEKTEQAA